MEKNIVVPVECCWVLGDDNGVFYGIIWAAVVETVYGCIFVRIYWNLQLWSAVLVLERKKKTFRGRKFEDFRTFRRKKECKKMARQTYLKMSSTRKYFSLHIKGGKLFHTTISKEIQTR